MLSDPSAYVPIQRLQGSERYCTVMVDLGGSDRDRNRLEGVATAKLVVAKFPETNPFMVVSGGTIEITTAEDEFTAFVEDVEPRLRRALVAGYGVGRGRDATIDALVYAWRKWDKVRSLDNPAGYLFRVGQNLAKKQTRQPRVGLDSNPRRLPWVEPGLSDALAALTSRQRTAVILHHSFDWTYAEIAEATGLSLSSVRTHADRALAKLRRALEVSTDA